MKQITTNIKERIIAQLETLDQLDNISCWQFIAMGSNEDKPYTLVIGDDIEPGLSFTIPQRVSTEGAMMLGDEMQPAIVEIVSKYVAISAVARSQKIAAMKRSAMNSYNPSGS